jgi:hypothetical protein
VHPRSVAASALWIALAATAALSTLPACGRDHVLGVTGGTGSADGAGGAGGAGSTSGLGAGGGEVDAGPPMPTALTIVNGINDYDHIRVCFLPYPGGDPKITPYPEAPAGLAFAGAAVISLADTVVLGKDTQPVIFAGDLTRIAGKTCDEATALATPMEAFDAGSPTPLVSFALPVLPASVFDSHRSVLLVPYGCLGGPGHDWPNARLACGEGYAEGKPTAGLVALGMTRKSDPKHLLFQAVNASAALAPSDIHLTSGLTSGMSWRIAPSLATGSIGLSPPLAAITSSGLGPIDKATINVFPPNQTMTPSATIPLAKGFTSGAVSATDLRDGAAVVLVGVGAAAGVAAGPLWHALTFALVKADP